MYRLPYLHQNVNKVRNRLKVHTGDLGRSQLKADVGRLQIYVTVSFCQPPPQFAIFLDAYTSVNDSTCLVQESQALQELPRDLFHDRHWDPTLWEATSLATQITAE